MRAGYCIRAHGTYIQMLMDSPVQKLWMPSVGDQFADAEDPERVSILGMISDGVCYSVTKREVPLERAIWVPGVSQLMRISAAVFGIADKDYMQRLQQWSFWLKRCYHQAGWFHEPQCCLLSMLHWMQWGIAFSTEETRLVRGDEAKEYMSRGGECGRKTVAFLCGSELEPDGNLYPRTVGPGQECSADPA